jgi:hypothetical protein
MDTFFQGSNTIQMQYKIYKPLPIKGYKFVRIDRTVRSRTDTAGGGVSISIYIRSSLRHKIVRQSTDIGVEFLFVEITLLNRVILVGSVYRPPNSSVFYSALEGVCSDWLSLYGEVFIRGDFNVGVLDPGHVWFAPFSD